ncbi:YqeG family HAD IIIA-type phosphatase [Lachnospiraceae bacterium 62-35]
MLKRFYPWRYIDSPYRISYEALRDKGIRGIIFDIDNTLVPHGAPADERAVELFDHLRCLGINTCLLSNNKEPRVKSFGDAIGSPYIYKGGKPSKKGYRKAMELMDSDVDSTILVGDQLFTDVWGANRSGIRSILVKPLDPREEIQIVLKRIPEKLVLWHYKRSRFHDRLTDREHMGKK